MRQSEVSCEALEVKPTCYRNEKRYILTAHLNGKKLHCLLQVLLGAKYVTDVNDNIVLGMHCALHHIWFIFPLVHWFTEYVFHPGCLFDVSRTAEQILMNVAMCHVVLGHEPRKNWTLSTYINHYKPLHNCTHIAWTGRCES